MSVQFEEDSFSIPDRTDSTGGAGLTGLLLKFGVVKNMYAANAVLTTLVIALIALTIFVVKVSAAPAPIGPQAEDFYKQGKQYIPGVPLR